MAQDFLKTGGVEMIPGYEVFSEEELIEKARVLGYPLAIKIVGPVHKTDVGGVSLNINTEKYLLDQYKKLINIEGTQSVIVQKMMAGTELFIGAKYEATFGHIVMCGLGGIFVEVLHDLASGLAPLTYEEAHSMISSLRTYKIIKGTRGKQGISEDVFADIIVRISSLLRHCVEVKELDLNPLIAIEDKFYVVDAKIRVEK
jgi:acetyltransferase